MGLPLVCGRISIYECLYSDTKVLGPYTRLYVYAWIYSICIHRFYMNIYIYIYT